MLIVPGKFVFVKIQKCASQSLAGYFKRLFGSPDKLTARHTPIRKLGPQYRGLPVVACIRNPWDWYHSWYLFSRGDERFKELAGDIPFDTWLKELFTGYHSGPALKTRFSRKTGAGVMTYRTVRVCSMTHPRRLKREDLEGLRCCAVNIWLRMEDLPGSLKTMYRKCKIRCDDLNIRSRVNKTDRVPRAEWYSDYGRDLVREYEWPIIEKFGFTFDGPTV